MIAQHPSYSKKFILTIVIPIISFWTVLFLLGYPIPSIDDLFFTGAAINLAKGGELTNPLLEAWNSTLVSGKFYLQPPFHSYTLAAWLKIAGVSTTSLRLFQYLCYNLFSLSCALLLRFYGFPRITALCTTVFFAAWQCNPNFFYSPGFRQDALGMAYLAFGLWLLTKDNWWRYFLGFTFLESAVFTSPVIAAYAASFGFAIVLINFIYRKQQKSNAKQYLLVRLSALLGGTALTLMLLLLCINFELQVFIRDFLYHASFRRNSPIFIMTITQGFGPILWLPTYILFILFAVGIFKKRYLIPLDKKMLFIALTLGIILNIYLYSGAILFGFFFCWMGIAAIILLGKWPYKIKMFICLVATLIYLTSQSINFVALFGRESLPASHYKEIKEYVLANPNKKYAIDSVAARFVFDYKLPKNVIDWNFMMPAPASGPSSIKDKPSNVTGIVSRFLVGNFVTDAQVDYPRIELLGRKFNSLPKKPFELIVIP
ncbi:MAG TPA: hypothetical protein V6D28_13175 [Leptolyngbyaceae cyanobacterium]